MITYTNTVIRRLLNNGYNNIQATTTISAFWLVKNMSI